MPVLDKDISGIEFSSLEALLPIGMIDSHESSESQNAARALQILERIIIQTRSQHAIYARYSLLQSLPRCESDKFKSNPAYKELENIPDFIRRYCEALCPQWFNAFLSSLTDDELEIFLKNYVHAHETWGHPEGIATVVRTMLEGCTHNHVPVEIRPLEAQDRPIPDELWSHLGNVDRYSTIGKDFVLGKRYFSRPEYFEILIGPISVRTLDKFQAAGWAVETQASKKLHRLVEFTEPFYLKAKIKIILETVGFILGKALLSRNRLGIVEDSYEEELISFNVA